MVNIVKFIYRIAENVAKRKMSNNFFSEASGIEPVALNIFFSPSCDFGHFRRLPMDGVDSTHDQ